jgi:energy-coupling factor transport system ATP-binding protein
MSEIKPLVIENLSFRYHSREELAIRNISLSVDAGQVLLIAGASGCGKTTLARCINGLIPRSYKGELSGKILLNGKEVTNLSLAQVSQIVGTFCRIQNGKSLAPVWPTRWPLAWKTFPAA